jgi:hypothetical protein
MSAKVARMVKDRVPPCAPRRTAKDRVADTWRRAGQALGYPLRTRDVAKLWAQYGEGEMPRPLSETVQTLVRDQQLRAVEGRSGSSRYEHIDAPSWRAVPIDGTDLNVAVIAALEFAALAAGRFVSTREVTDALPRVGYPHVLDKQAKTHLWQALLSLSLPKKARGSGGQESPAMARMAVTMRPDGGDSQRAKVYWWCPATLDYPAPTESAAATAREAAVRLVETVRSELGVPPTSMELQLFIDWCEKTGHHADLTQPLENKGRHGGLRAARLDSVDLSIDHGRSGVRANATEFTAGRLVPPRLSATPLSQCEQAVCRASDALLVLRPAKEQALITAAIENASAYATVAHDLAQLRRWHLRQRIVDLLPEDEWPAVLGQLKRVVEQLTKWLTHRSTAGRGSARSRASLVVCARRLDDIAAVEQALKARTPAMPERFRCIELLASLGTGPTLSFRELDGVHDGLRALQRGWNGSVHPVFKDARRIPRPRPAGWRAGKGTSPHMEHVDRVDAYAAAVELVGAPQTATLVRDAVLLLGVVLRDNRVVRHAFETAGGGDDWVAAALLVSAGLLGTAIAPEQWLHRSALTEAGVLGIVLADPAGAEAALRRLVPQVEGRGRQVIAQALMQVHCGEWLALLG